MGRVPGLFLVTGPMSLQEGRVSGGGDKVSKEVWYLGVGHPRGKGIGVGHPRGIYPIPPRTTEAGSRHPTRMLSCYICQNNIKPKTVSYFINNQFKQNIIKL